MVTMTTRRRTKVKPKPPGVSNIMDACLSPYLFKPWFEKDPNSWRGWMAFLKTMFALPFDTEDQRIFEECTGRKVPPNKPYKELWLVVGRRGGKSLILSLIAVWLAIYHADSFKKHLQPGERATIMLIAVDRKQARTMFRYITGFIDNIPTIKKLEQRRTMESIELNNQVAIEIHTSSFRTIRGYTIAACLLDEAAFFRSDEDSSNPDKEILTAIQPAMKTIPNSLLLCASSPYGRKGILWENYNNYYGEKGEGNDEILVWQAPTWVMNRSLSRESLDRHFREDFSSANAEYGAEFRTDVESFVRREAVEQCTMFGRYELPPSGEPYIIFVDPSGGSQDSFTLAVAHKAGDRVVLDCVREVIPPFSPDDVVQEYCNIVRSYGTSYVMGDRYGGEWPRERFDAYDIYYEVATRTKSDIYRDFLPLVNAGMVELLDHEKMLLQLINLERRVSVTGRDTINHPPGQHDDVINAAAGAIVYANEMGGIALW